MTEFQANLFAYGVIFLLLGLPLIWAVIAMFRQLAIRNISREITNGSRRNWLSHSSFLWGLVAAFLFAAKSAFAKSEALLGLTLLAGASIPLWQIYRQQRASSSG